MMGQKNNHYTREMVDLIYRDYIASGLPIEEIADKHNIPERDTIFKLFRKFGYDTADRREMICPCCGETFKRSSPRQVYCSKRCRRRTEYRNNPRRTYLSNEAWISEIARKGRACGGMSYGQYVAAFGV